ncbi:hypothetical protein L486_00063 [Kwoniella mangroviensis CBS 10435]|uniref:BZIP domain-containing protein n=1 Tax=Kwoniella mangroviensis CBS 10435 TaxID=1331196 RepID=A0A1B9IY39_9TREE|nr:hypothetical protein L486_00063 [Kwoniella mangroviensis CBS 10435]
MFGLLQPSGQSSYSGNTPLHSPPVHKVQSLNSQTSQHVSYHRKRSSAASTDRPRRTSPINLPQYPLMTRPIRDERRLAPLPPLSHTSQPGLSLTFLADAALADARGPTSLPHPHPNASFTLPPISSLIAPLPTPPAANPDSSLSTTATAPYLNSSGSIGHVSMHTPPISRSHSWNANPAMGTDQPVNGWSTTTTAGGPSSAHMTRQGPFPPPPVSQRPLKREKQRKQTQSRARATTSAVQLEYNVRPYNRMTASTSSVAAPSRQHPTGHAATRTQPSRSSKAKLPHPLQGLTLDKTYPERKVEDWHNDAQNLLRPPRPRPNPIPPTSLNQHSAAQSLNPPPPPPHSLTPTTVKKIHPPVESWENYTLPQMPGGPPCLPQFQPVPAPVYPRPSARRHQSCTSVSGTSWNSNNITNAHTHNASRGQDNSYVFVTENPEVFTRSRHRAPPISDNIRPAAYAMQRSQSAHTTQYTHTRLPVAETISQPNSPPHEIKEDGQIGGSLPTPITASMDTRWNTPQLGVTPSSTFQHEVLSLLQVQTPTPPLLEPISSHRTSPIVPMEADRQSTSPSFPPTRDMTPIDQEMRNNPTSPAPNTCAESPCGSFGPPESVGQPELEAGESSYSESDSEPVSEDNQDQVDVDGHDRDAEIQVRFCGDGEEDGGEGESYSNFGRSSVPNGSSAISSNSSVRARSSSQSTHTSEMIKYDHPSSGSSSASSPTSTTESTSCFSPGKTASKKPRTKSKKVKKSDTAAKGKGKGKGRSNDNRSTSTSVSANSTANGNGNGQRRNGERRREQNAVAQKKFRWKKKQMAAKMEADLESATALASSLQKQVAEKDQLVNKLKGEVGSLKRKLKTLEA